MAYNLEYESVLQLKRIISSSNLPDGSINDFKKDIKKGFQYIKLTWQKNYLEKLLNMKQATPEVIAIAKKMVSTYNTKRNRHEEARVMRNRISNINKELRIQNKTWENRSREVEMTLDPEA